MMKQTIVIGLDSATWDVIAPLLREGHLPNLNKLIERGVRGILRSYWPPLTPVIWPSMAMGVNPGKHGVYGFFHIDPGSYGLRPVANAFDKRPAVWDIFNAYGLKVGVLNFPMAYPPPSIDSFFVSGVATPEDPMAVNNAFVHPPERYRDLAALGYRIYPRFAFRPREAESWVSEVKKVTQLQAKAIVSFMKQEDVNLIWMVFLGLDHIQHYFLDPASAERFSVVAKFYEFMDNLVGELLKACSKEANVLVISDHGMNAIAGEIHLNTLLESWGYLRRTRRQVSLLDSMSNLVWNLGSKLPLAVRLHIKRLIRNQAVTVLGVPQRKQLQVLDAIDWSRTRAFSFDMMGRIYINTKDRYYKGIVDPDKEYIQLREEIADKLRALRHPQSGKPLIAEVHFREDLYSGPEVKGAPDIIFSSVDWRYAFYGDFAEIWLTEPGRRVADHNLEGIFIVSGPSFKQSESITTISVFDVGPMLLQIHGLPSPRDLDGQIPLHILSDKHQGQPEIYEQEDKESSQDRPYSEDEARIVQRRLEELGYL